MKFVVYFQSFDVGIKFEIKNINCVGKCFFGSSFYWVDKSKWYMCKEVIT